MCSDQNFSAQVHALLAQTGIEIPDPDHASRVATFACALFERVWPVVGLKPEDGKIVLPAALFYEAGSVVSHRDSQRKTYDVLRAEKLPGLTDSEHIVVACAARYHSGPYPSIEHTGFRDMDEQDQRMVRRIAGIGRVAIALDASRLGVIRNIDVDSTDRGVVLVAYADEVPTVESDSLREAEGSFLMLTQIRLITSIRAATHESSVAD